MVWNGQISCPTGDKNRNLDFLKTVTCRDCPNPFRTQSLTKTKRSLAFLTIANPNVKFQRDCNIKSVKSLVVLPWYEGTSTSTIHGFECMILYCFHAKSGWNNVHKSLWVSDLLVDCVIIILSPTLMKRTTQMRSIGAQIVVSDFCPERNCQSTIKKNQCYLVVDVKAKTLACRRW